jgi:hypothetical protein
MVFFFYFRPSLKLNRCYLVQACQDSTKLHWITINNYLNRILHEFHWPGYHLQPELCIPWVLVLSHELFHFGYPF